MAIVDLARSIADIYTRLASMETQRQPTPSATASLSSVFPYEMLGYGTTTPSF
jgi:hypothetical protein